MSNFFILINTSNKILPWGVSRVLNRISFCFRLDRSAVKILLRNLMLLDPEISITLLLLRFIFHIIVQKLLSLKHMYYILLHFLYIK